MESERNLPIIQPTIHTFPFQSAANSHKMETSNNYPEQGAFRIGRSTQNSKPHLIMVPHEDQSGHQQELIREVYRYPPGTIKTVVEKNSTSVLSNSRAEATKRRNHSGKKKFHTSQSSVDSSNSAFSNKSISSLPSQTDSTVSEVGSSVGLNTNDSDLLGPVMARCSSRSPFIHRFHEGELSDSSSNISTMSDLSGYEDEYTTIKRLISDSSHKGFTKQHLHLNESLRKKTFMENKILEQENTIKSLQSYKEELEIQVHRLSIQLQNAVREKEVSQEQLDLTQTKLTEKKEYEYFEVLKEKVTLEGQYETLKQEYQHISASVSQLTEKLLERTNEYEHFQNACTALQQNEKVLKNKISTLEKQNLKLENEMKDANEAMTIEISKSLDLKTELEDYENTVKEMRSKIGSYNQESESYLETIQDLKKWNLEYSEREEQQRNERRKTENLLSESLRKFNTLKENSDWYQSQLSKAQTIQSDLQSELTETKSCLTLVSAEKDRLKREVERLTTEIENNRVKAVRDKSLLLLQLEELEADMREREVAIRKLEEGDKVSHVKVSEERFKRLEEDHKRLQEMKIELRDVLRHNDSLKEDLNHKYSILRKQEDSIHELRKDAAMLQEKLGSKQVCIDSTKDKLNEAKNKVDKAFIKAKEDESTISHLREENAKLKASVLAAEEDKLQVDKTVSKLKEDMSKLSSNFFKMKHDLSAKDKQIEILSSQVSQLSSTEKELRSKIQCLSAQVKNEQENESLISEIGALKESNKKLSEQDRQKLEEVDSLKKKLETSEVEKKSLASSVQLRDERIENMQGVIDAYKEKMLQKDEEIFTKKDHLSRLEKSQSDLQKRFSLLNNDFQMSLQEKEQFIELEINYKNSITELKENVKLEKRSKESCDRKYKEVLAELASTKEILENKTELCNNLEHHKLDFEEQHLPKLKLYEESISKLNEELKTKNNCVLEKESIIETLEKKIEEVTQGAAQSEVTNKESIRLKEQKIVELQSSLSANLQELEKLKLIIHEQRDEFNKINSLKDHSRGERPISRHINKKMKTPLTKDDRKEFESTKRKLKETLTRISKKDIEISKLNCMMSEYENLKDAHNSLVLEIDKMKQSLEIIGQEKESVSKQCLSLQESLQEKQSELCLKEEECNEWKLKYENLVDTIPQRDTNTQLVGGAKQPWSAVATYSEVMVPQTSESIEGRDMQNPSIQDFSLDERVKFTQTMHYLQKQISFTAEALQNKDSQIMELNRKLNSLTTISHSQPEMRSASSQTISQPDTNNVMPNTRVQSLPETFCSSTSTKRLLAKDDSEKVMKETSNEKEAKEELVIQETEFKAKQKRYESNLRLLTRKLKEHMKGRRIAEKELDLAVREAKKNMETESNRYQTLRNRYIDLEKKFQYLESEIISRDALKKENDHALKNLEESIEQERKSVLRLQKEVGQIEELKHCGDILKDEITTLRSELTLKSKLQMETNESLQSVLKEKKSLELKREALASQVDQLTHQLKEELAKGVEREKLLALTQEDVVKRDRDISDLKGTQSSLELKCNHLEESVTRIQAEDANNAQKIAHLNEDIEGLKSCVDMKNALIEDLNSKNAILEKEIQLKKESIESLKEEGEVLTERLNQAEDKYDVAVGAFTEEREEAKRIESSLNETLSALHKEKLAYQSQCTQLKVTLNSALEKFQAFSTLNNLPSPAPLNTETLTKLLDQCSKPPPTTSHFRNSLSERLSSLRQEVFVLKSEIKAREESHL